MQKTGLRARKRQQTHEAIVAAALRVFTAKGYDAATLEDVASDAKVAKRTLLRYFPSKSALLLHGPYRALHEFKLDMAQRAERSVLDVWEAHVRTSTRRRLRDQRNLATSLLIEREQSLAAEQLAINREYHEVLATALMSEIKTAYASEVVCNVIAGGLVSGQSAIYRHLMRERSYAENVDRIYQVVQLGRDIIAHLEHAAPKPGSQPSVR